MIRRIRILAAKELKSFFDSPFAYVLLIVWLVISSYFFFRAAFLMGEASLRPLFELLPWLLLFFVPAVTMRSLSAEKQDGTLEVLLSHPINEVEIIAAKLIANVGFVVIALLLTLPIPLGMSLGGRLDLGMMAGQYLGAVFLIIGLSSVGIFASSLSKNQTVSFIIALFFTFLLISAGLQFVIMAVPFPLTNVVRQLSALAHFDSMTRGVIGLADIVYFAALTMVFSTFSYFGLRRERESHQSARYKMLRLGTALIIIVSVLVSLIGSSIGGRVDLTAGRLYSLSGATSKILRELPDVVTIKLYSSRQLPPEAEAALRDIKDVVLDYQAISKGRVKALFLSPKNGAEAQAELQEAGIEQVQFNVVRQDEYQVKKGFLGLTVEYGSQKETIPFINQTADLEYQLSRLIRKISSEKQKKVVFLEGHSPIKPPPGLGAENPDTYGQWRALLAEVYQVEDLAIKKGESIPKDIGVVIIAGPTSSAAKHELKTLTKFIEEGGSVLALIDSLTISDQTMGVVPNKTNFTNFLAGYGLTVQPRLLFDMQSNQMISAGSQDNYFSIPYPFWMQVQPASDDTIVRDIGVVTIPWGQSLKIGKKSKPLLVTTQFAGFQAKDFDVMPNPEMNIAKEKLSKQIVAASRTLKSGGRLIVVGDSDFLKDKFVAAQGSANGVFGQNAVDWLAQDASLAGIRSKNTQGRMLVFQSEAVRDGVRYFNLGGVPLIVALLGFARLSRRRQRTRKVFAS